MGTPDAAPLRPDGLRPLFLCRFDLELVAERTDLASPSLTAPKRSCDWAFWYASDVGDSTTVFGTGTKESSWRPAWCWTSMTLRVSDVLWSAFRGGGGCVVPRIERLEGFSLRGLPGVCSKWERAVCLSTKPLRLPVEEAGES